MAKIKYSWKENKTIGTHSVYAVPVAAGTLTSDEFWKRHSTASRLSPAWPAPPSRSI